MLHTTNTDPIRPSAWCDECGDPNPVAFRRVTGQRGTDTHSLCAACWGTEAARLTLTPNDRGVA